MYTILVVGAGYAGSAVARYFRAKGQRVYGVVQSEKSAEALRKDDIQPVVADLTRPETLQALPPANFVLISAAPDERTDEAYRRIYLEGVKHALTAIGHKLRPHFIIYLSSTGVYGSHHQDEVDESTAPEPDTERGKILLEAEEQILNSGYASAVLRLSGIYGPGRNRLGAFRDKTWPIPTIRDGSLRGPVPNPYMNMIHVEDIAEAVALLFKTAESGEVYLGVDDEPVRASEFCGWLSEQTGISTGAIEWDRSKPGKRCRNQKLKDLGWKPKFPTFREGYRSLDHFPNIENLR